MTAKDLMSVWDELAMPDNPAESGIIYIAGPMSSVGPPTWNYPAFHTLAAELRAASHQVINPAELQEPSPDLSWDWYLRRDLRELVKCSRIALLPNYFNSRGARLELHVARALGMQVFYPHMVEELLK